VYFVQLSDLGVYDHRLLRDKKVVGLCAVFRAPLQTVHRFLLQKIEVKSIVART
jgi:hypothetical protein